MEYEYMALSSEDGAYAGQCRAAVRNKELADKGWKNWRMIPWYESGIVSICVVRRELRPKDQPRMWTEGEIEEIAKGTQGSVLNERAMQADLCGRLERRNAELQTAIDNVAEVARRLDRAETTDFTLAYTAIVAHLYPLVTKKEESNG